MHPMSSVTLTHTHHAEAQRVAGLRHHGRSRPAGARARTEAASPATARTGLRAMLRSATEVPQRLVTTFRPVA